MCGADPDNSFPATLVHKVHPRVHGVEYVNAYYKTIREWLIPVRTGADTKFLKQIPVVSKPFFCLGLLQQNQYVSF